MSASTLRAGVIGAGYWGKNLVRNCAELGALAAVCDADPATRVAMQSSYPQVTACATIDEILSLPLDAVIVATPAPTHAAVALAVLSSGKHVFVEKPLALTVEEGERVAALAERTGKTAFVGHLLLYHPAVRRLLSMIAEGAVGSVWHVRSRRMNLGIVRSAESVWWSFAPHDIALMLAIMDAEPVAASAAQVGHLQPGISDMTYADFQFADGRSAHVEASWLDPQRIARIEVFGTSGVLALDDTRAGSSLVHYRMGVRPKNGKMETWREEPLQVATPQGEPLREELEAFFGCVRTGARPPTDARRGVAVLRALAMVDRAALASSAANGVPA